MIKVEECNSEVCYDLLVCALGFETRATYVANQQKYNAKEKIVFAFSERKSHSYEKNKLFFQENDFIIYQRENEGGPDFYDVFSRLILRERMIIGIDISSMSRTMIAEIILCLERISIQVAIDVDFFYAPAQFSEIDKEDPIVFSAPVVPEMAGWARNPELPPTAIFGTGTEFGRAVGTVEYLEPSEVWAFNPIGESVEYDNCNSAANEDFLEMIPSDRIFRYDVSKPYSLFVNLESLVYGLTSKQRTIIVPFGPKIFALIGMLVFLLHRPNVTVWRVSGDQKAPAVDKHPSGTIASLRVLFSSGDGG